MMHPDSDSHSRSATWFTMVGIVAAVVHYVAAVTIETAGISAGLANPAGFLLAFPVSYLGHRHFSFAGHTTTHRQSAPKFLFVALIGFGSNHLLLLLGLHFLPWPFWLLLGLVMLAVAIGTYFLSRYWAFKST